MSRIDEALKRAGVRSRVSGSVELPLRTVDEFASSGPGGTPDVVQAQSSEREPASTIPVDRSGPVAGNGGSTTFSEPADMSRGGEISRFDPAVEEKVVVSTAMRPMIMEQYRRLAASLHQIQQDRAIRTVMVASALAGEGKTLTATNLALTLSESYGRSVLLIDADLRRPMMHEVFQARNDGGLSDGLKAASAPKLALVDVSPRLSLLPAGSPEPNPLEGLTSERMRQVIQEGGKRFDWVILDTPPVELLPDASLLGAMIDAAVLVIDAQSTPYSFIQQAIAAIGRDRIVGVVLNRADEGATASGKRYRDYYASGRTPR